MSEETEAPSISDSIAAAIDVTSSPDREGDPVAKTAELAETHREERLKPAAEPQEILSRDKQEKTPVEAKEAPAPTEAAPKPPKEPDGAPASWKDDIKAKWSTIAPEVQGEIMRRERDIAIGLQRAAETRKFGDSIAKEVAPYMDMLQKEGATPQQAVKVLLETFHTLRHGQPEHKKALILSMLDQYGIDFRPGVNPEVAKLQGQIDQQNLQRLREQGTQQHAVQQGAQSEVEAFEAQPGHEYVQLLKPAMAGLLNAGLATGLQDAYDKALWGTPETRQLMMQQQNQARQADLSKNRRAASSVTGAPGNVASERTVDVRNIRQVIEDQMSGGRL